MLLKKIVFWGLMCVITAPAAWAAVVPSDGDSWSEYEDVAEATTEGWGVCCALSHVIIVSNDCHEGACSVGARALGANWCKNFYVEKELDLHGVTQLHFWHQASWEGFYFRARVHMEPTPAEALDGITEKYVSWVFDTTTTWTEFNGLITEGEWHWYDGMWNTYGGNTELTVLIKIEWSYCNYFGIEIGDEILFDGLYFVTSTTGDQDSSWGGIKALYR